MNKSINILHKLCKETSAKAYYTGEFVYSWLTKNHSASIDVVLVECSLNLVIKYLKQYGYIRRNKNVRNNIMFCVDGEYINISVCSTLKEDADNKDFTIDALYIPIDNISKKHLIDFYDGIKDIKARRIRSISGINDLDKMFQSIMLAAKLNYRLDDRLFTSIRSRNIEQDKVDTISPDILRNTFISIVLCKKPSRYFKLLETLSLLKYIIPELNLCIGVRQNKEYHKHDVFTHSILACDNIEEPNLILRLAALMHDIGKLTTYNESNKSGKITFYSHEVASAKIAKTILKRLGLDKDIIYEVAELVYLHMYNYEPEKWSDSAVNRFIKKAKITKKDINNLDTLPLFLVRRADRLSSGHSRKDVSFRQSLFQERIKSLIAKSEAFTISDLAINGVDIMNTFKLKEGPTIGNILRYLVSIVDVDRTLNTPSTLIDKASEYLSKALE
jgi:putative nucleotidyltransferase with HDIG domain